jgi:tight adherence protein C
MDILVISFLITVMMVVFSLTLVRLEKKEKTKLRIDSHVKMRAPEKETTENLTTEKEKKELKVKLGSGLKAMTLKLREYYKNSLPTQQEDAVQMKLLQAGNPFRMTVADYFILNNVLRVATPLFFGLLALILNYNYFQIIGSILIGFALSFKAMDFYLFSKTRERHKKALRELPDFLDILTISVEAGLGFDLALSKTIEKRKGILPTEFNTCLEEMRLGKTRREALSGVKERLNFDEITSFVNSIIQSEKLGTGIVNTLRAKSEEERDKRKQRAEEQAMKTTIKILIPLILLIFPSIFIVILGPAAIQLFQSM